MPEAATADTAGRESFGSRLGRAMADRGPLCVGIDPHPALLPRWGLNDDVAGLERFSLTVLEAVASLAAAVKPQVALYERHGSAGMAVLERTLAAAAEASVLTIADAKRGDIGSTMAAYADAWLRDGSALAADSVTLSPYLGFESLRPALDLAAQTGRGVFVLALTSNPEGASVQHVGGADSVARRIVRAAAAENRRYGVDQDGGELGSTGLVVGATVGSALTDLDLDLAAVRGPILAPGLGAQGATAADLRRTFGSAYGQVLGHLQPGHPRRRSADPGPARRRAADPRGAALGLGSVRADRRGRASRPRAGRQMPPCGLWPMRRCRWLPASAGCSGPELGQAGRGLSIDFRPPDGRFRTSPRYRPGRVRPVRPGRLCGPADNAGRHSVSLRPLTPQERADALSKAAAARTTRADRQGPAEVRGADHRGTAQRRGDRRRDRPDEDRGTAGGAARHRAGACRGDHGTARHRRITPGPRPGNSPAPRAGRFYRRQTARSAALTPNPPKGICEQQTGTDSPRRPDGCRQRHRVHLHPGQLSRSLALRLGDHPGAAARRNRRRALLLQVEAEEFESLVAARRTPGVGRGARAEPLRHPAQHGRRGHRRRPLGAAGDRSAGCPAGQGRPFRTRSSCSWRRPAGTKWSAGWWAAARKQPRNSSSGWKPLN